MKAIIFGVNGQDGFYLKEILRTNGIDVIGISRSSGDWIKGDVADYNFVSEIIKKERPNFIFHLAANSSTRHEFLFENHETISTGTINILESVYKYSKSTKVFISGSALQFRNDGHPIHEKTDFEASSSYSFSRIHSVYTARYFRKLGVKVYVGYFFNHESPLRSNRHVSKMIVEAVKRVELGSDEKIEVGDISVMKEWNFAGDIANAIYILITQDEIFEAVIGSGTAHTIKDWLELCFGLINKDWRDYVTIKDGFVSDYKILVSNPTLIYSLGYRPLFDIRMLSELMIKN